MTTENLIQWRMFLGLMPNDNSADSAILKEQKLARAYGRRMNPNNICDMLQAKRIY